MNAVRLIRRHRVLFGALAILLSIAMTAGICLYALVQTAAGSTRLTVVIDAGHGGVDGGVVGRVTHTKESDINLAIARKLQAQFEEAGFSVVQTRPTEAGLYGAATSGYKKRDMQRRAEIIADSAPAVVIRTSFRSRRGGGRRSFFARTMKMRARSPVQFRRRLTRCPNASVRGKP